MWEFLGNLVLGLAIAYAAAKIALRDSYTIRRREQLEMTYTTILESLHDVLNYWGFESEAYKHDEEKEWFKSRQKALSAKDDEATAVLARMTDLGAALLPSSLVEALKEYERDKGAASATNSWNEHVGLSEQAAVRCRQIVRDLAARDLAPPSFFPQWLIFERR